MAFDPSQTGLIGGLEKREIKIVEYDPNWPRQFEVHSRKIGAALDLPPLTATSF